MIVIVSLGYRVEIFSMRCPSQIIVSGGAVELRIDKLIT